jgi:hypothetical protein
MNQQPRPITEMMSIQKARAEALDLATQAYPERSQRVTPRLSEAAVRGSAEVVADTAEPAKVSLEERRKLEELVEECLQTVEAIGERIGAYRAEYNAIAAQAFNASDVTPKDHRNNYRRAA